VNNKFQLRRIWSEIRWGFISILWLISLVLGYAGFSKYAVDNGFILSITERIYRSLQLISMNSGAVEGINNWMLEISRFLLPALTAFTAFQAASDLFQEQMQWFHLWRLKNHIIICGLGHKGSRLVESLLPGKKRLLVIQNNLDPIKANEYRRNGVILIEGNATDIETLESARLSKASHLVCFLGEDQQNLNIAHRAFHIVRKNNNHNLTCIVHLASQDLFNLVKRSELNLTIDDPFVLETFNIYDRISHQLIRNDPGWTQDGKSTISTILILGLGRLGQNICQQSAYTWYTKGYKNKLNIIVIDQDAQIKVEKMIRENPQLESVCNLTPVKADLSANYQVNNALMRISEQKNIQRAYVCLGNPILSLQVGLTLGQIPNLLNTEIYVRLDKDSGLSGIIANPISGIENHDNLIPFDIYEETCTEALVLGGTHELLARKLNENFQLSLNAFDPSRQVTHWNALSKGDKDANRKQAGRIHRLLKTYDYHISPLQDWNARKFTFTEEELHKMAKMEHELWCQWKQKNGWEFGEKRDNERKFHPDLVPWNALPEGEKRKNIQFIERIPELLADLGFQIEKLIIIK
jgi:hypothetical protein